MDERRRYFRIDDDIGIRYEVLSPDDVPARQAALDRGEFDGDNKLQLAERQLQLLIDKLRVQNPEFAEAVHLLNTKFNSLKDRTPEFAAQRPLIKRASISACGVSFQSDKRMREGDQLYLDLTLLPTDLHVHTLAEVVGCREIDGQWLLSADFFGLSPANEELMVQHIVKRQGRLLAEQRQDY
ncbi:MAG: hypothetical protein ACJAYE_000253 [Candidatus Azotimanducaceae bacterium]|jgi:hypothetical protein